MSNYYNHCHICLSTGRQLIPLKTIQNLLQDIKLWELLQSNGGVCFECRHLVVKFYQFKWKIVKAQYTINNVKPLIHDLHSLSKLSLTSTTKDYSEPSTDPLTQEAAVTVIKQEDDDTDDVYESYSDTNVFADALYPEIDIKTEDDIPIESLCKFDHIDDKICKQTLINCRVNTGNEEIFAKNIVDTINLSEEDMINQRKEKRNEHTYKELPYKCKSCILGFDVETKYKTHIELNHFDKNRSKICNICEMRFKTDCQLALHREKHYKIYKCNVCNYTNCELLSLWGHCKMLHKEYKFDLLQCCNCSEMFKSADDLENHRKKNHSLQCTQCNQNFKTATCLGAHLRHIHGLESRYLCDMCKRSFRSKQRLEKHIAAHGVSKAPVRDQAYCAPCNVQFKNKYIYKSHLRNSANHAQEMYKCTECNSSFASKSYRNKHYDFYHLKKSKFQCKDCDKVFISGWRLNSHRQMYHGVDRSRNYDCDKCGKKFFTMATLKGHQLTHSEERKFMCSDCGDTFKQRPSLYTHIRLVHKGIKRDKVQKSST